MQVSAKAFGSKISFKKSIEICDELRGKKLSFAKTLLQNLIDRKESLDGKYHTDTAKEFLTLLNSAEANAKQKNLDANKLFIKTMKADKGYKFIRPKSLAKFRGRQAKVTNLQITVEER